MSKHFTFSLFGLALIVFFAWIVIAGTPLERLNRGCAPIVWGGKAMSAVTDIFSDNAARHVWHGTSQTFQGCRFVFFKTFYQDQYNALQAREAAESATADKAKRHAGEAAPAASAPPASRGHAQ